MQRSTHLKLSIFGDAGQNHHREDSVQQFSLGASGGCERAKPTGDAQGLQFSGGVQLISDRHLCRTFLAKHKASGAKVRPQTVAQTPNRSWCNHERLTLF